MIEVSVSPGLLTAPPDFVRNGELRASNASAGLPFAELLGNNLIDFIEELR